jgi:hypothetical protein
VGERGGGGDADEDAPVLRWRSVLSALVDRLQADWAAGEALAPRTKQLAHEERAERKPIMTKVKRWGPWKKKKR